MKGGRRGLPVKTLKRFLKKAGLKTSGKKAALTRRAKKAGLRIGGGMMDKVMGLVEEHARNNMNGAGDKMMGAGDGDEVDEMEGSARPRRSSRRRRTMY